MCIGMANGGKTPKTTDKDIIKALELCTNDELEVCDGCAFQKYKMGYDGGCLDYLLKSVFDLINRQQAEIERLNSCVKSEDEVRAIANATIQASIKIIKTTTIKELEVKIHEKLHEAEMHGNFEPVVTREMFDSVVKGMVGADNG
jgi:hypothetical protein